MAYVAMNTPMAMAHTAREATKAGDWERAHDLRLDLADAAIMCEGPRSDALTRDFDLLGGRALTSLDTFEMLRSLCQRAIQAALAGDWKVVRACAAKIEDQFTAVDLLEEGVPEPISLARATLARRALEMIALHQPISAVVVAFPGGQKL